MALSGETSRQNLFMFDDYDWHRSEQDPSAVTRRAFGMEVVCDLMPRIDRFKAHGNAVLGYQVEFTSHVKLNMDQFTELVYSAWMLTRLDIPNAAVTISRDQDGWPHLVYRAPKSHAELADWAHSTLKFTEGTIYEIRNAVGGSIFPDSENRQLITLVSPNEDLGGFGFVLQGYHTAFDMAGAYMLMNCFLKQVAILLDRGNFDVSHVPLGEETARLLPPPDDKLLGIDQFIGATNVEERLLQHARALKRIPYDPGLKPENKASYQCIKYYLSQAESAAILRSVKKTGFTVSQILHAAAVLAILSQHPPQANEGSGATLNFTVPVNLRGRLKAPYNQLFGYPGFCVLSSPLQVPLSVHKEIDWNNITHRDLMTVAALLKPSYQASVKTKMSDGLNAFTNALERLVREQGLDKPDFQIKIFDPQTEPAPAPILTNRIQACSPDGIGENLVVPLHRGPLTGQTFLTVSDFYCSINHSESVPGFRIHSWAGGLHLTLNYNDRVLDNEAMQGYLDRWAHYTRAVLQAETDPSLVSQSKSKL